MFHPTVFAVGDNYMIFARVNSKCSFGVRVGKNVYHDHDNGILRTAGLVHCVTVPMRELDAAGGYTVVVRPLKKRLAYYSVFFREFTFDYRFYPVPADGPAKFFHVADTHGNTAPAIQAYKAAKTDIDCLILNGDIFENSEKTAHFDAVYELAGAMTGGERPVIYARGNHDLRGAAAEFMGRFLPTENGCTYYTVRLGRYWFLILDCGEDKDDSHPEYGGANCCHEFRLAENAFFDRVVASREYEADGTGFRFVVAHYPFPHVDEEPFNIEQELYRHWCDGLRNEVRPDLMLCGHTHKVKISEPGSDYDDLGQPCRLVIGSQTDKRGSFTACLVTVNGNEADVKFVSNL
ncbi:MAG: metallophosphoesterase [Clostridia bacterium]|nr:metallophosphoesterase [Clostridia bacterium]